MCKVKLCEAFPRCLRSRERGGPTRNLWSVGGESTQGHEVPSVNREATDIDLEYNKKLVRKTKIKSALFS